MSTVEEALGLRDKLGLGEEQSWEKTSKYFMDILNTLFAKM